MSIFIVYKNLYFCQLVTEDGKILGGFGLHPHLAALLLALARDFTVRWIPCRPETISTADVRTLLEQDR